MRLHRAHRSITLIVSLGAAALLLAPPASAEQAASATRAYQAGLLDMGGGSHACAILDDGSASCWGQDSYGQLGDDAPLADKPTPTAVALPTGRRAVAISAGNSHTCAILDDGSASCWGSDFNGQLGDDALLVDKPTPTLVALPTGRRAVAISAGGFHTCAILDDGSASCWGQDSKGQLGDDTLLATKATPTAVALPAGRRAVAISTGTGNHTCVILDDGSASCWGWDLYGQLGDDAPLADKPTPTAVALPTGRRAVAISAGYSHTCAILDDASASCWGYESKGQLGDDTLLASKATPVTVALPAGRRAVAISAGEVHTCAILDDGSASCWGRDDEGQLGDDTPVADKPTPTAVALLPGRSAAAISAGRLSTCALQDDGSVGCWGSDALGELGNGPVRNDVRVARDAPLTLPSGATVGRAADLSLALEGVPGSLTLGATTTVSLRLRNAGPDTATGIRVLLDASLLALAPSLIGQGSLAGGYWQAGSLASGGQTTLTLTLTPLAAGAATLGVEITGQGERDPDSTPANDNSGEDDQASTSITVKASVDRLTLKLSPNRDTTAPYTTRASGRLVATTLPAKTACAGSVRVTARAGRRTLASRTARLKLNDGACQYTTTLGVSKKKRGRAAAAKITAVFAGNDRLLPARSIARVLRFR